MSSEPAPVSPEPAPAPGPNPPGAPAIEPVPLTLDEVKDDPELSNFISAADRVMEGLGYTEHGFRHANLTGRISYNVMTRVGFDEHMANLACVAGYLHDVGNMISREAHGQTGGVLVYKWMAGNPRATPVLTPFGPRGVGVTALGSF